MSATTTPMTLKRMVMRRPYDATVHRSWTNRTPGRGRRSAAGGLETRSELLQRRELGVERDRVGGRDASLLGGPDRFRDRPRDLAGTGRKGGAQTSVDAS